MINPDGSIEEAGGGRGFNADGSFTVPKLTTTVLIVAANYGIDTNGNLTAGTVYSDQGQIHSDGFGNLTVNELFADGGANLGGLSIGPLGGTLVTIDASGRIFPVQATTASAPAYAKGALYFDTTLNKLRVGGATAWETVTSA